MCTLDEPRKHTIYDVLLEDTLQRLSDLYFQHQCQYHPWSMLHLHNLSILSKFKLKWIKFSNWLTNQWLRLWHNRHSYPENKILLYSNKKNLRYTPNHIPNKIGKIRIKCVFNIRNLPTKRRMKYNYPFHGHRERDKF